MAEWIDVQQNTEEWESLRIGRIGGSSIGKIMANYGKAFGDPAKKLAQKIAIEQITGRAISDNYSNGDMERGHEQEPIARALYEDHFFSPVTNGGYFVDGNIGVSPDGLVDSDGMIEIKSVIYSVHFDTIKRNDIDPSYKWQLYFNLMISGREWIDFVSFCADFPEGKKLFVRRVYAKESTEYFAQIDTRLSEFWQMVYAYKNMVEEF
jgi:hypothetical protein